MDEALQVIADGQATVTVPPPRPLPNADQTPVTFTLEIDAAR